AKILYYKNIVIDWTGSAASQELETIEGGYLQSEDDTYPVVNQNSKCKFIDISLPEVKQWWMDDAAQMLDDPFIDGIFIDANIKALVESCFLNLKKTG
ncbi:MAG: putative glycoside hydrolase, partial [Candidatus Latescibacterota bacterium]|nr:putative glycoside hydrolase [Candidatus Latescibacterota bacterium]